MVAQALWLHSAESSRSKGFGIIKHGAGKSGFGGTGRVLPWLTDGPSREEEGIPLVLCLPEIGEGRGGWGSAGLHLRHSPSMKRQR